jgi:16S rRNA U516 pseudouridylate synthase RsuA-like enzyme
LLDPKTKKTSVRTVDLTKPSYKVSREYMIRLEKEDFENSELLEKMAKAASGKDKSLSAAEFRKRYEPAVTALRGGI